MRAIFVFAILLLGLTGAARRSRNIRHWAPTFAPHSRTAAQVAAYVTIAVVAPLRMPSATIRCIKSG